MENNLPAAVASAALHPLIAVTVLNLRDGPVDGGIGRVAARLLDRPAGRGPRPG